MRPHEPFVWGEAMAGPRAHPVFATLYDALTGPVERRLARDLRRQLLRGCEGHLLDLGAGTGANLPVLREVRDAGTWLEIDAVEPDPFMLRRARRRAAELGLDARFHQAPAEALPFADGTFDVVVSTLVLCTVGDLGRSLGEISRVLRPGGTFRFLEHVREGGAAGRWQDRLRPLWAAVAGGCQLNRRTGEAIRQAGFLDVRWDTRPAPFPVARLLIGSARRA